MNEHELAEKIHTLEARMLRLAERAVSLEIECRQLRKKLAQRGEQPGETATMPDPQMLQKLLMSMKNG